MAIKSSRAVRHHLTGESVEDAVNRAVKQDSISEDKIISIVPDEKAESASEGGFLVWRIFYRE